VTASRAEYMRNYRATRKIQRDRDRWWIRTRNAAMEQLAREHPERFTEILAELRREHPWAPEET
jgi:hypothetical protein